MRLTSLLILFIFIGCNMSDQPQLSLLVTKRLTDFSSASAIEFYKDKFYIIGDDSRYLLITDKQYNVVDTIVLFPGESHRIAKKEKSDLEAATIHQYNGKDYLIAVGSGSTLEREDFYVFPLADPKNYKKQNQHLFYQAMKTSSVSIVNIEGMAMVNNYAVFGNRANLSMPDNHFFVCSPDFLHEDTASSFTTCRLELPSIDSFLKGISGMCYVPENDLLLFTASVENTASAIDDGAIGNSYLGYIKNFSGQLKNPKVTADTLVNLSTFHAEFSNEKVESICVESVGKEMILHLVADNDDGTSTLFKLSMPTPPR
jgi:hypothetical protein